MQPYPHHYSIAASAAAGGNVDLSAPRLAPIVSAPPAEFGGPGDLWSPETLLVAALADCFVLTFRAIARASKLEWTHLDCDATGVLDRADGVTRFVSFEIRARLALPAGGNTEMGERLLAKAEKSCLVTHSLVAPVALVGEVRAG